MPNFETKRQFHYPLLILLTSLCVGLSSNTPVIATEQENSVQQTRGVQQALVEHYTKLLENFINIDQLVDQLRRETPLQIKKFRLLPESFEAIDALYQGFYSGLVSIPFQIEVEPDPEATQHLAGSKIMLKLPGVGIQTVHFILLKYEDGFISGHLYIFTEPQEK